MLGATGLNLTAQSICSRCVFLFVEIFSAGCMRHYVAVEEGSQTNEPVRVCLLLTHS